MRWFWCFCSLFLLLWWSVGRFRARGSTDWTPLQNGLETRVVRWRGVKVRAFRAAPSRVEVAGGAVLEARDWLRRTRARVAVNGGYFDEHLKPLGLRVSNARKTSALRRADWGVFWISGNVAHISHTRDFNSQKAVKQAMQCGPRLVVNGKVTDLKAQWSQRTGVGIDADGKVVLAVCDGRLALSDWAQVFASPQGLNCRDALNLDGGPSTQIAYSTPTLKGKLLGGGPVPDALIMR